MPIDKNELLALSVDEKFRIIELLWNSIENESVVSFPDWIEREARRRMAEMESNPDACLSHDEVWRRIGR